MVVAEAREQFQPRRDLEARIAEQRHRLDVDRITLVGRDEDARRIELARLLREEKRLIGGQPELVLQDRRDLARQPQVGVGVEAENAVRIRPRVLQPRIIAADQPLQRAGIEVQPHFLARSEEHTSELQSLMRNSYDVFCLKKKKNTKQ